MEYKKINEEELMNVSGGGPITTGVLIVGGLIGTPVILGTISGFSEARAKRRGY